MKRFCSKPFNRMHISVSGEVFFCCSAWLNLPIGNIFKNQFEHIWNSRIAKKIRKSILNGSFKFCNKDICPHMVSGAITQEVKNKEFLDIIREKRITLNKGPRLISLNYDYSCNLYCESCRDSVKMIDKDRQEELIQFQNSFLKSDLFKNAKRITVSGTGEVFASKVYLDLFNKIKSSEHPDLKIILRTNGLLLTPENWERLNNIHYAIDLISISIDAATEKTYRKLRRGGNFNKLLDNLGFLKELKKKYNFEIKLNFVVQKSNYLEMPEFVTLAKKYDCDRIAFSKILNLGTYISEEYKNSAVHRPDNPEFSQLKTIINSSILKDPIVNLRNLSNLIE